MLKQFTIAVIAACPFPHGRGTPLRIQRLSEALVMAGHEVHIFTYPIGNGMPTDGVSITRTQNPLGYKKYDAGPSLQKPLLDALLTAKLARFIAQKHVDIIYAHHFEGALVALAARRGQHIPIVYDAHTTLTGELGSYNTLLRTKLVATIGGWLDSFVPRRSDHVISVSDEIAHFLSERGISSDRISVILNGTESEVFAQGDASRAREKFHLDTRPTVIYTGNLASFQGVDHLLIAMPQILAICPNAQLIIAGSGDIAPYLSTIAKLGIEQATHIVHNPVFSDVVDLLALADVAVVPRTVCPGIPLKLLNYMAAGKAVVAFEGSAKILKHLDTGYIVTNGDMSSLADGIITCLSDEQLRKQLGAKAREVIIESYNWDHMAARVAEVFEQLVIKEQQRIYALN